jgi:hypothetical protein
MSSTAAGSLGSDRPRAPFRRRLRGASALAILLVSGGGGCGDAGTGPPEGTPVPRPGAVFPLHVSPNGRFLEDAQGAPFFVHGDTFWSITHNLTYDEAVRILEDRRRRGVNALVISAPDAYGPDGAANKPPDRQGNQPFAANDLSRPDEAYWRNVDRVLSATEDMGFLVLFFPAYLGCCNDGYVDLLQANGAARAQAYGRFLGERYRGRRNIIWVHGGDLDPGPATEMVVAVRDGIRSAAPGHLHAGHWAHDTDSYGPLGADFVDLYTSFTYGPVSAFVSRDYRNQPTKPALLLETHYENDFGGKRASDVIVYPYRAVLSGAAGHFFGNKPLWYCGRGWESALDSEASRGMEHVARLFHSRPWERLVPDQGGAIVVAGRGDPASDSGVQAARAEDGSFAMVFVPDQRSIRVALRTVTGPTIRASWFAAATGRVFEAGMFPPETDRDFVPPVDGGAVLVLDDARAGFPLPGASAFSSAVRLQPAR